MKELEVDGSWVVMVNRCQSMLIALIATGQLAVIGKQKVLHPKYHLSWAMMGDVYVAGS